MNFPTHGKSKTSGKLRARNGDGFVPGNFATIDEAKRAAEAIDEPTDYEDYED